MRAWIGRGLWMALLHGSVQTGVAAVAARRAESGEAVRPVALVLLVAAAVVWGAVDGWRQREDRGTTWFGAALLAGPLAGVLGVLGTALLVDQSGTESLGVALTGGAAFTALLVLAPAAVGLGLGGALPGPADQRDEVSTERRS
ncbi:B-4DMT family transporter [Umezawaea beigongshangensis]|uniref:B-4DMT family transporter n=1 Tax=Umezawaea beigongshangensis TaxID=2780383 RepID=UPI0018F1AD9A|nr:B-4DMT family transporter [Umezawaea beigongshangensis]